METWQRLAFGIQLTREGLSNDSGSKAWIFLNQNPSIATRKLMWRREPTRRLQHRGTTAFAANAWSHRRNCGEDAARTQAISIAEPVGGSGRGLIEDEGASSRESNAFELPMLLAFAHFPNQSNGGKYPKKLTAENTRKNESRTLIKTRSSPNPIQLAKVSSCEFLHPPTIGTFLNLSQMSQLPQRTFRRHCLCTKIETLLKRSSDTRS